MSGWKYKSGVSGTVSVPDGAKVKQIRAFGGQGATMTVAGGDVIDVSNCFREDLWGYLHGPIDVVFSNTDHFFVSWVK